MNTSFYCRKATLDDLQAIINLLTEDELGKTREQLSKEVEVCYIDAFRKIDADPNQFLMIAIMDNKIVGTCHLSIMPSLTFKGRTRMQIEAVRIAKEHRGQTLGKQMINAAIEYGKTKGASLIQLATNKKRHRAKQFYEQLGFTASHEGMKLHLL
jgi:N-acetylglutamate synthase-like GNAT family acetyltransferase